MRVCPECGCDKPIGRPGNYNKCYQCGCEWVGGNSRPVRITYPSPLISPKHSTRPYHLADAVLVEIVGRELENGFDGSAEMERLVGDEDMYHLVLRVITERVQMWRRGAEQGQEEG